MPSRLRTVRTRRPRALRIKLPAFAGRAMEAELDALDKALGNPEHPVAAVVGGAKVSTKLDVLKHLVTKRRPPHHRRRDGKHVPSSAGRQRREKSLCEHELTGTADEIFAAAEQRELHDPSAV